MRKSRRFSPCGTMSSADLKCKMRGAVGGVGCDPKEERLIDHVDRIPPDHRSRHVRNLQPLIP